MMEKGIFTNGPLLPAEVVLAPAWWFANAGITFDEDFFYNPARRVEDERKMEKALYERWGRFGLGENRDKNLPLVGPVHLAAGYLFPEMFGCKVEYKEGAPPQQSCAELPDLNISAEAAFESGACKRFQGLVESLEKKYGYVVGDVGVAAILNLAMDLRGENLFLDMFDKPDDVGRFFEEIAKVTKKFTQQLQKKTGSTSISVNRTVRHLEPAVFVHSECSHTMISVDDYEKYLFKYDAEWSLQYRPFGIHFCGTDPHRYAQSFAKLPNLDWLDVGWGGDVKKLRQALPDTFLNIRLSPVEIIDQSVSEIEDTIRRLVTDSAKPHLTGLCCINMDEKVSDEKISCIFETAAALREEYSHL